MNVGDIVLQRKKLQPVVRWAKSVIDAESALVTAQNFIGDLDNLRVAKATITRELAELQAKKAAAANELHAECAVQARDRDQLATEISEMRRDAQLARAKTEAQVAGYEEQIIAASEKHAELLASMTKEVLALEDMLAAAQDKYHAFMKEITSHG